VSVPGLQYVDNDRHETTGELHSLALALDAIDSSEGALYVCYGDVLFRRHALELLVESTADLCLVVDSNWQESANLGRDADFVSCSSPASRRAFAEPVRLRRMDTAVPSAERHGEWIGLMKVAPRAQGAVRELTAELLSEDPDARPQLSLLLNRLVAGGMEVQVVYTAGNWLDVDSLYDVIQAGRFGRRAPGTS
jgi:phosphoenolpyruvate phosphomutase